MEFEYIPGMNLGYGFNTATYDIHSPALEDVTSTREVVNAGGQEVFFRLELASSTLSLSEQLNISARASLKYGVVASGSAKTDFFSKFKQNSFSVYIFVQTIVTNKQTLLDLSKVKLKANAANLFVNHPLDFAQQYGDSFIYGLITGGEFLGVLEIESSSASEFREIKAKLSGKGGYGLFSGSASASFEQSLKRIESEYQMKASIMRQGGEGLLTGLTPEQLRSEALNFPAKVQGATGYPYAALAIPYNHIERPIASPLDLSYQTTVLERLGLLREQFIRCQNNLEFALEHVEQFPGIEASRASNRYNQISMELEKIRESAHSCFFDLTKCSIPSLNLDLLENILPPQIEGDDGDMEKIKQMEEQLNSLQTEIKELKTGSTKYGVGAVVVSLLAPEKFFATAAWKSTEWAPADGRDVAGSEYARKSGLTKLPKLNDVDSFEVAKLVSGSLASGQSVPVANDCSWHWIVSLRDIKGNRANDDREQSEDNFQVRLEGDKVVARGATLNWKHNVWGTWKDGTANYLGIGYRQKPKMYYYIKIN